MVGGLDGSWRPRFADVAAVGQRVTAEESPQTWTRVRSELRAFLKRLRRGEILAGTVAAIKRFGVCNMIEASIAAVPGLIVSFLILAALIAAPTALVAKARKKPWPLRTALAVYLAGILAVTLLPGDAGLQSWQCDTGAPTHLFTSASSLLNIALFVPGALLAVPLFKRPVTVAAAFGALSGAVEIAQSAGHLGRSCSVTDLAANATGALLGTLAGALWIYRRRQSQGRPLRDLAWGMSLGVLAVLAIGGVFDSRIERVNIVAIDDQKRALAESAVQADEWITTAARGVFGSDTQVRETN